MLETDLKKMKVAVYCRLSKEESEIEDDKLKYFRNKLNKNFKKYLLNNYKKNKVKYRLHLKNTKLVTYQTSADGDSEYLEKCMSFYKKNKIKSYGLFMKENEMPSRVGELLKKYNPDILVLTGHDSFSRSKRTKYKNTSSFVNAVMEARKYEKSHEKLFVIAGACQSNYEDLIKAGANFASSPKRINIHALDPAIVASCLSFSNKNNNIDIIKILDKTKYGSDGMGGIITKGTMYIGYPR